MKKNEIQVGQIVCSKQGRDAGEYYIVLSVDDKSAFVVNGEGKKINKPKSKNLAHLKGTAIINNEIASKIKNNIKINDQMIYHSLYEYKKGIKGSKYGN